MAQDFDPAELRDLPVAERLKLIEDLWDSIDAESDRLPLPDWHRAEIDRRLDALDAGVAVGASPASRDGDAHRPARGGGRSRPDIPLV